MPGFAVVLFVGKVRTAKFFAALLSTLTNLLSIFLMLFIIAFIIFSMRWHCWSIEFNVSFSGNDAFPSKERDLGVSLVVSPTPDALGRVMLFLLPLSLAAKEH